VADGTTVIATFDSLGVSLTLAGAGVPNADGSYTDGDLDGKIVIVQEGVGGQFQLGGEGVAADRIEYDIKEMTASDPVLNIGSISIGTRASSRLALAQVDEAIDRVSRERGAIGAIVNRLQHTIGFSDRALEGVVASESTVRDADFALESSELARAQLLSDLSQSAMVQAGTPPNIALSLLTG
jgi:flagellin